MSQPIHNNKLSRPSISACNLAVWNCHTLSTCIDDIRSLLDARLSTNPLGLLALIETKWDATLSLPPIQHYTWHYRHHYPRCGGIACLVHDSIPSTWIDTDHPTLSSLVHLSNIGLDSEDSSAIAWLEILPPGWMTPILVGIVYLRPPVHGRVMYKLQTCIDRAIDLIGDDRPLLLMGDFNLRHPFWDASIQEPDQQSTRWMNYIDSHHLSILNSMLLPIRTPTRPSSLSTVDLLIANDATLSTVSSMRVGIPGLTSDHFPLLLHLSPPSPPVPPPTRPIPRIDWRLDNMSQDDWKLFSHEVDRQLTLLYHPQQRQQLSSNNNHDNPSYHHRYHQTVIQRKYDCFEQCIHRAATYVIGIRKHVDRAQRWWKQTGVADAFRSKQIAHAAWMKDISNPSKRDIFQHHLQHWHAVKAQAKQQAWSDICASLQSNPRQPIMWRVFRRTRPSSFSSLTSITHPVTGALPSSLPVSLDHMAAGLIASGEPPLPPPSSIQQDTIRCIQSAECISSEDESDDWTFTPEQIKEQCQYQHTDTAAGADSIAAVMLQHGGDQLYEALSDLFTYSWRHAVLPRQWTDANVFPLYKGKGPKHITTSFRPISITSVIIRTFEHLIHHRLSQRLEHQQFFHVTQFGFRAHHSTYDAIYYLQSRIKQHMHQHYRQPLPVAFLDLTKAFDRVNPDRLLYLLYHRAGIRGCAWRWIRAFLSHRRIRVTHQSTCSDWHSIRYGVPQGCVLSPLLFLVFINEIVYQLSITHVHSQHPAAPQHMLSAVDIIMFADDIAIMPNVDMVHAMPYQHWTMLFQQALDVLTRWATDNQMEFSRNKSNIVLFGSSRSKQARLTQQYPFTLQGFTLQRTDRYTYLGLIHDSHLTWRHQYQHVLSRIRSDSYLISRLIQSHGPPHFPAIRALCMGYLRPRCTYALAFWQPSQQQLQQLQSLFLRPMLRLLRLPFNTNRLGLLVEANCPSFHRYRYACMHKFILRIRQLPSSHPSHQLYHHDRTLWNEFRSYVEDDKLQQLHLPPGAQHQPNHIALHLTYADYAASNHWDDHDPTWLRQHKTSTNINTIRPHRSLYLYHEYDRDMACLRARLRLNRVNNAINTERRSLRHMSGCIGGLCHRCSQQHDTPIRDTVEHILMSCSHYASARQRLQRQLSHLPWHPPWSMATIMGVLPAGRHVNTAIRHQRQQSLLHITASFFRSIAVTRSLVQLPAL